MNNISDTYIVAADAVTVEPVAASSFPADREINREFCTFRPIYQLRCRHLRNDLAGLELNSLLIGTGNIFTEHGNLRERTGGSNAF